MNVAAIAATGMRSAALRLDAAAAGIVVGGATISAPVPATADLAATLPGYALSALQARSDYQAGAVALRRADAALGALFDAFA